MTPPARINGLHVTETGSSLVIQNPEVRDETCTWHLTSLVWKNADGRTTAETF